MTTLIDTDETLATVPKAAPRVRKRKRFWRHLLRVAAQASPEHMFINDLWDQRSRETYLRALEGDRYET